MPGTLFVVATPIGNLEDLTFRALRTLKEVDLVAAEDTRRTAKLLAHYEIRKPVVSLREHNEVRETPRLIGRLSKGQSIALVTDAGTPGIADPGAKLVAAAHQASLRVVPIPGPSAVTAALSVSGFGADEFAFMGFPPRSGRERSDWLDRLAADPRAVVFFEAPHRIEKTIGEITEKCPYRVVAIARELTKIHESLVISPLADPLGEPMPARGEFVGVIGPATPKTQAAVDGGRAADLFGRLTDSASVDPDDALMMVGRVLGASAAEIRKAIKKHKISVNQQNRPSS